MKVYVVSQHIWPFDDQYEIIAVFDNLDQAQEVAANKECKVTEIELNAKPE